MTTPPPSGAVRAILAMRTRPGCEQRFEDEWRAIADQIRTLAGCLRQDLLRDADDPRSYLIVTDWADRGRLDAFGRSAQRDRLLRVIRDLRESAQRHTYQVLHSVPSQVLHSVPSEPEETR
ncbi:antibiotic biosynthesis monooxygenase family protein [Solwaraspora sp. WMMA2056]|uniref:putative quinol monooxygenase n=1 Tax=Solwaraspora sp. WMMA2056 TaxID=3015161 RepID=UPI00259B5E11|nr:antibiotic biosynthesis monooxygenase family protein [Solwaraspora sp. WMMA2056]WJK39264.1 antibiotic biosynthesis monooxygenase family protein [Solwaraspora sp. WMMA2056]